MDDLNSQESLESTPPPAEELSHTDKISGLISSPVQTFEEMSFFKPRIVDWLMPIIVLILVTVLSNLVIMSSPEVKSKLQEKQIEMVKEGFDKQVESGDMTTEEAEKQFNTFVERMQESEGMNVFANVNIIIGVFLVFFIISLVFFLVARFILKDYGTYSHALVACGFPSYITAIQVIVTTLITVLTGEWVTGTSLNTIVGADSLSISGFLMGKLDPFRIWYYLLISIGFAKMFKSPNITKYYITIFGIWIGFGLLMLLIAQQVPLLRFAVM